MRASAAKAERAGVVVEASGAALGGCIQTSEGEAVSSGDCEASRFPIVLRSSSSGFAWGNLVYSHYKSSCLRWILIQSHRSFQIKETYQTYGKLNEDRHAEMLESQGTVYERELEVSQEIPGVDGVVNTGHIDFVTWPKSENRMVHELKHVQSKTVRREVIRKGLYITDNLAQCVNYMLQVKTTRGLLKYSFWEHNDDNEDHEVTEEREFQISIDDFGRIFVDGVPTKFTVHDQLNHQRQAALILKTQTVGDRPYLGEAPFVGACNFCPAKEACAKWDSDEIEGVGAFVEISKQCIEEKERSDADAEV